MPSNPLSRRALPPRRWCQLVTDIRRKRTEANMITSPAWMLEGRTFAAATGAACGSPQFVTRDIRPPPDDGDGASKRCVMLAALAPKPDPRRYPPSFVRTQGGRRATVVVVGQTLYRACVFTGGCSKVSRYSLTISSHVSL
jgi:hypothetical protein